MNPILLSFPETFNTTRLTIRAPIWGDGVSVNEAVRESAKELGVWLPVYKTIPSIEESESYVRKARLSFLERTDLVLHLFDKYTGEFVGSSGLHRINWDFRSFEIGYWIRSSRSGQGLVSEAVKGIADFAVSHLEANRIEIRVNSRNFASIRVAERAGFMLEGVLRKMSRIDSGELVDLMIYSKVRGYEYQ